MYAVGRWPLAVGRWPLAVGRWPLAVGRWPLAARLKSFLSSFIKNSAVTKLICRFLSFVKRDGDLGTFVHKSEERFNESGFNNKIKSPAAKAALPLQKGGNFGFTLIELLVVVVIIGILAAIAIPQYQKSITRSRVAKIFAQARPIAEAEEEYYLINDKYASDFTQLSINLPCASLGTNEGYINSVCIMPDGSRFTLFVMESGRATIMAQSPFLKGALALNFQKHLTGTAYGIAGRWMCFFGDDKEEDFCKSFGGEKHSYRTYVIP